VPASVALLVLASALLHAVWNAILKRRRDPEHAVFGVMFAAAAGAGLVALVRGAPAPPGTSLIWCFVSGVLEAGYFLTLARALTRAPLGPVYTTVRGGALIVVWPISVLWLGEQVTWITGLGTLLVLGGLTATGVAETPPAAVRQDGVLLRRLGWAVVCALFVGGYHLSYKVALAAGGEPEVVVAISLSTASLVSVLTLGRERRRRAIEAAAGDPLGVVSAGALATLAFVIFLVGMAGAGAGAVFTLRNTSILFAQVVGFALGERPKRLSVIGAVLVTGGAVLLAR
jgi:drug/metabolite transporter (DMT)-like permease